MFPFRPDLAVTLLKAPAGEFEPLRERSAK